MTPSAAVLGPAQISHTFPVWITLSLNLSLPVRRKVHKTKQCHSSCVPNTCGVKDDPGVSAASALCLHLRVPVGLAKCWWGHLPKRGRDQRVCAEPPRGHSELGAGPLPFRQMKALGAYGDIQSQHSFTSFSTNRYVSPKIRAKLKSKLVSFLKVAFGRG